MCQFVECGSNYSHMGAPFPSPDLVGVKPEVCVLKAGDARRQGLGLVCQEVAVCAPLTHAGGGAPDCSVGMEQ